jgi:hypothetical protein
MIGEYTHPSMPRTAPMMLSAALEDAEGHALVAAIHNPDNPRLVVNNRKRADGNAGAIASSADTLGVKPHGISD